MIDNFQLPLFSIFISAMVTENLIFARATGIDEIIGNAKSNKQIVTYSIILFFITFPSVSLIYPIKNIWMIPKNWHIFRGIIILTVIFIFYLIMKYIIHIIGISKKIASYDGVILLMSFNCTSFMIIMLSLQGNKFFSSIIYCIGACFGVMISMLLLHSGKERLEISNVHRAFRGLPITLIYIGILSMAVYGLIGHKLLT